MTEFITLLNRIKGNRSIRKMSTDTNISASYITELLKGKYIPSLDILGKLLIKSQDNDVTLNMLIEATTGKPVPRENGKDEYGIFWFTYPNKGGYRVNDEFFAVYDEANTYYKALRKKATNSLMKVTVAIDIKFARKVLVMSSGSKQEAEIIEAMNDVEIKDEVLKHCKCWAITEVKGDE